MAIYMLYDEDDDDGDDNVFQWAVLFGQV